MSPCKIWERYRMMPMCMKGFMKFRYVVDVIGGVRGSNVVTIGGRGGKEECVNEVQSGVGIKDDDDGMVKWGCVKGNSSCMDFPHVVFCWHRANLWWEDVGSVMEWNWNVFLPVWVWICMEVNCKKERRGCSDGRFRGFAGVSGQYDW